MKFFLLLLIFFSINVFSQENNTKLFKTSKKSIVTKSDSIDIDQYKDLIVISYGKMFERYFEKIGYFKEVITYDDFIDKVNDIKKGKLVDENNYLDYYNHKKGHLTLYIFQGPDNNVELSLGLFGVGPVFTVRNKSKTILIGISAGTKYVQTSTWDSMMNEVVNYIRSNSKTYK